MKKLKLNRFSDYVLFIAGGVLPFFRLEAWVILNGVRTYFLLFF